MTADGYADEDEPDGNNKYGYAVLQFWAAVELIQRYRRLLRVRAIEG